MLLFKTFQMSASPEHLKKKREKGAEIEVRDDPGYFEHVKLKSKNPKAEQSSAALLHQNLHQSLSSSSSLK